MKKTAATALTFLCILLCSLSTGCAQTIEEPVKLQIENFDQCVAAGFPVMRSFPPKCASSDGRIFVQEIGPESKPPSGGEQGGRKLCVDRCGDGICQEIVCMAQGCPCPEDRSRCPKDCSRN